MKRPKYSILTLLLIMALVAVSLVLFMERNRATDLMAKNQKLARELGVLQILDPASPSVRRLEGSSARRFRTYLPPGSNYKLAVGTVGRAKKGIDFSNVSKNEGNFTLLDFDHEGEFNFSFSLSKLADQWSFSKAFSYSPETETTRRHRQTVFFKESHINNILDNIYVDHSRFQIPQFQDGLHGAEKTYDSNSPIVLLEIRHNGPQKKLYRGTLDEEVFVVALVPVSSKTIPNSKDKDMSKN